MVKTGVPQGAILGPLLLTQTLLEVMAGRLPVMFSVTSNKLFSDFRLLAEQLL